MSEGYRRISVPLSAHRTKYYLPAIRAISYQSVWSSKDAIAFTEKHCWQLRTWSGTLCQQHRSYATQWLSKVNVISIFCIIRRAVSSSRGMGLRTRLKIQMQWPITWNFLRFHLHGACVPMAHSHTSHCIVDHIHCSVGCLHVVLCEFSNSAYTFCERTTLTAGVVCRQNEPQAFWMSIGLFGGHCSTYKE